MARRDIERAKAGDQAALSRIVAEFLPVARGLSRGWFAPGHDREDLEAEALFGLSKAVRDFKLDHPVPFEAFARLCMERQIVTAVKTATRKKHSPLNGAVGFADVGVHDSSEGESWWEPTTGADAPFEHVTAIEAIRELAWVTTFEMSMLERTALQMIVDGEPYATVAQREGVSMKTLDNALQRARRKLAAHLGIGLTTSRCEVCDRRVDEGERWCASCTDEIEFARNLMAA